ncbi:MAG: UDP-N-acetylmuramoyl-tripeptide--D-alanyl-D-alanine ligase [Betaproteobacteria bacterium]|nr:UDP-N-acetylmuramoyl-tripeptide--D-alanyl-D-alanine ligase [Betaproteobacteria bacterium]
MSFWTWNRVLTTLGVAQRQEDFPIARICTDSRQCQPGDLFVALPGERFDGHQFLEQALQRGACAVLVERLPVSPFAVARGLQVPSTLQALARLSRAQREILNPRVIAVTGSNGKTTVKEMVANILRASEGEAGASRVWATPGNFNNAIGVPLTLLQLTEKHRWAVVEMGMNHAGEIAELTAMALPDVALITNVQRAHLGFLGSLEQIACAKAEIFSGLGTTGVAIFPETVPFREHLEQAAQGHRTLTFGLEPGAAVQGTVQGGALVIRLGEVAFPVRLQVPGRHNQNNALAAAAVAYASGVAAEHIRSGLEAFSGVAGRLQSCFSALGALILNDTYNANPDSVRAALAVLAEREGRRILVLGDLGELGEQAPALHAELGHEARALGIDECYTVGELAALTSASFGAMGHHEVTAERLVARLRPQLNAQTVVLVKGSRFMKMETIVAGLLA